MSTKTNFFARLVSIILAVATLLPLVSCSSPKDTDSAGDKDDFDLNGFTLTVLSGTPFDNSTPTDLMSIEEAKGDTIKESVLSRNSKVKNKYGLDVEQTYLATDASIIDEVVRFTAAQDDAYKCCTISSSGCVPYISQGVFNNVNNLPNIDLDADYWDSDAMDLLAINGFSVSLIGDILFSHYESASVLMLSLIHI